MSIKINVDYTNVKVCITVPQIFNDVIQKHLLDFKKISIKSKTAFCYTFNHQEFIQFLEQEKFIIFQNILESELQREILVSGLGALDSKKFEEFMQFIQKYTHLTPIKSRGIWNSLNTFDYLLKNEVSWFYRFTNLINILQLTQIKKGILIIKENQIAAPEYPFLFVNVNKNVSFYRVDSNKQIKKLSGSIIGDSTIESILSLLGYKGELNDIFMQAFEEGDSSKVDLSVGDIYGEKVDFQLPKNLIASTLGKAQFTNEGFSKMDVIKSLWFMFAINLGMLSFLTAKNAGIINIVCNTTKLTFEPFLFTLQVIINAFSQEKQKVFFIEHSEYITVLDF